MNNNFSDSNSAKTYRYGQPQGNAGTDTYDAQSNVSSSAEAGGAQNQRSAGADANSAQDLDGEEVDKFEQFKKRLKEHPEDMIILSELMKPKF